MMRDLGLGGEFVSRYACVALLSRFTVIPRRVPSEEIRLRHLSEVPRVCRLSRGVEVSRLAWNCFMNERNVVRGIDPVTLEIYGLHSLRPSEVASWNLRLYRRCLGLVNRVHGTLD